MVEFQVGILRWFVDVVRQAVKLDVLFDPNQKEFPSDTVQLTMAEAKKFAATFSESLDVAGGVRPTENAEETITIL